LSLILLRVITYSQPRNESPGRSRRKPAMFRATAAKTSCPTSAASAACSPARRHQPYTRGPYNDTSRPQASSSCARTRASNVSEVCEAPPLCSTPESANNHLRTASSGPTRDNVGRESHGPHDSVSKKVACLPKKRAHVEGERGRKRGCEFFAAGRGAVFGLLTPLRSEGGFVS